MDVTLLEKIKKRGFGRSGVWEADFAAGPMSLPNSNIFTLLVVHRESYFVMAMHAVEEINSEEFVRAFLHGVEKNGLLPNILLVTSDYLMETFSLLAQELQFELKKEHSLMAIPHVRRDMNIFFRN
jgi:hypothetical protein